MADAGMVPPAAKWAAVAPLRHKTFRTIWLTSLLSNFGQLILGVGAAWEMTRLTSSAEMVAAVQTAMMVPLMLIAVPAGAIADMFDRRKVVMAGLAFAAAGGATLTIIAAAGLATPWILLGFCVLIGVGVALYGPAWQASISDQVGPEDLPAAVALGSISYNLARSFGPAVGGIIVMAAGAVAAFALNAVFYLPLLAAFFFWRRVHTPSRLPPERIDRAIISGARYAMHSPPIRTVLVQSFTFGIGLSAALALTPLVARDRLGGDASTYGLLLGAIGAGAVIGALLVSEVRRRVPPETAVRMCILIVGLAIIPVGLSRSTVLTCLLLAVTGAGYILLVSLLNVSVQLASPRWVTARALAWFQSSITGGIAGGAIIWGHVASGHGVGAAFIGAGIWLALLPLIGLVLPMPDTLASESEPAEHANEPEVALAITARSGPIIIEVEYRIDPVRARDFYKMMLRVQRVRLRNGGFGSSLSRDIADPASWTERYHCPTWGDYLRQRSRFTLADRRIMEELQALEPDGLTISVRRRLERPFGSVRYRNDTPDPKNDQRGIYTP